MLSAPGWRSASRLVLQLMVGAGWSGITGASAEISLHTERSSPFDLEVSGDLVGLDGDQSAFVRWADIRALPVQRVRVVGEFVSAEQELTVVWLQTLWENLPRFPEADLLAATCTDGYAAFYTTGFMERYRPFVVLEIDGRGPEHWPPPGLNFNPAPYVISVSAAVEPAVATLVDANHKRPWGVRSIHIGVSSAEWAGFHSGRWGQPSPAAARGRDIWINSCASCHRGPAGTPGGTKSDRPFEVIWAHAAYNRDHFKRYVRDPKAVMPGAKMEAHPHYTDTQLDELIAFITADGKPLDP